MSFEGIVEILTTDLDEVVNEHLTEGWELLAVTPGKEIPMYTIGRRAKKKAPKISPDALKKAAKKS